MRPEKLKAKITAAKAKIAAKARGKSAAKTSAALVAVALMLAGCSTSEPASRLTRSEVGDLAPSIEINVAEGSSSNTFTITANIKLGDGAISSADSSGSTETTTANPTNTTDIKPDTDVNTTGGRSAGVLETLIGAAPSIIKASTGSAGSASTTGECKDCTTGECKDCTVGTVQ